MMYRERDPLNLQHDLGFTQSQMARAMGLPLRTYEDLVKGRSILREVHRRAAYMAVLEQVAAGADPSVMPRELRELVDGVVDALTKQAPPKELSADTIL